jgi:hypothetical protein
MYSEYYKLRRSQVDSAMVFKQINKAFNVISSKMWKKHKVSELSLD